MQFDSTCCNNWVCLQVYDLLLASPLSTALSVWLPLYPIRVGRIGHSLTRNTRPAHPSNEELSYRGRRHSRPRGPRSASAGKATSSAVLGV